MLESLSLEGKNVVITGGGTGLGLAMVRALARAGATLAIAGRRAGPIEAAAAEVESLGSEAISVPTDVTDAAQVESLVQAATERFGKIDVLINNAGAVQDNVRKPIWEITDEDWHRVMDVNLKGLYRTSRLVVPIMRRQEAGVITAISSIIAVCAADRVIYKASKAGMNAFCHMLATSNWDYGIRVNVIMPGLMDTPIAIGYRVRSGNVSPDEVRAARDAAVPLRRKMGTGWDTAFASLFLASDEARFITGVTLPVDGGMTARIG